MYSLLIIDDQKKIREGLRHMVSEMDLPIHDIQLAENGAEALQRMEKQQFDILLLDIRMPVMDGLEFMEACQKKAYETNFLVISGFDDFMYAKKALEFGAKAYLLKPIVAEELQMRLNQVIENITNRAKTEDRYLKLSKKAADANRRALSLYMRGAIADHEMLREISNQHEKIWSSYRLYLLKSTHLKSQRTNVMRSEMALPPHLIIETIHSLMPQDDFFIIEDFPHILMAVTNEYSPYQLSRSLHERSIFSCTCVSSTATSILELQDLYPSIHRIYKHSYLFPEKQYLSLDELSHLEGEWEMPWNKIHELFHSLGSETSLPITLKISDLFDKTVLQQYNVEYYENICASVLQTMEKSEKMILPWVGKDRQDLNGLRNPFAFPDIHSYLEELQKQMLYLNHHYFEMQLSYRNDDFLSEAISYIHQNYSKAIDLSLVANHVHLNYAYFSSVFKKNVGKSFSEYLRDVRVDKAKTFLETSDEKITAIAKIVGFESYRSFVRSFQNVTGMQASEYRNFIRHNKPK